jgi:hypothetical protein
MHDLRIERAVVVPNLSMDLTSHLQCVENGHTEFFHKSDSRILHNTKPIFAADYVIITFFTGSNEFQICKNLFQIIMMGNKQ